jgi:hypothetical protein
VLQGPPLRPGLLATYRRAAVKPIQQSVFWWFQRGSDYLRYESREIAEGEYELRVTQPDGSEQVERFVDSNDLTQRQRDFERALADEGWTGPHGWNL